CNDHGWHRVEGGALVFFYGGQGLFGLEGGPRDDHGGPVRGCRKVPHDHAKAMVIRHRNTNAVLVRVLVDFANEIPVVEDVAVRKRRALWKTRGPGGVLDIYGVSI